MKKRNIIVGVIVSLIVILVVGFFSIKQNKLNKSIAIENQRVEELLNQYSGGANIVNYMIIDDNVNVTGLKMPQKEGLLVYEKFLEFEEEKDIYKKNMDYVINVLLVGSISRGLREEALEIMSKIDESNLTESSRDNYYIVKTGLLLEDYKFDEVIEIIDKVQSTEHEKWKNYMKAYLNEFCGVGIAYDYKMLDVKVMSQTYKSVDSYHRAFSHVYSLVNKSQNIDTNIKMLDKNVSGRITYKGKPVEGLMLYIKSKNNKSNWDNNKYTVAVTDEDGYYSFEKIPEDSLEVVLSISDELLGSKQWAIDSNKIDITNTEKQVINYKFADGISITKLEVKGNNIYYELEDPAPNSDKDYVFMIGNYENFFLNFIGKRIESQDEKGVIKLADMKSESKFLNAFKRGSAFSENSPSIELFFEQLYLEGEYKILIAPTNTKYDDPIIYGLDYMHIYEFESLFFEGEKQLSEGDLFLEKGKIEEALSWYENNLSMHSLLILSEVYREGYYIDENDKTSNMSRKMEGVDNKKAIYYLEQLIDEYGESYDRLSNLAQLYHLVGEYDKEKNILDSPIFEYKFNETIFELAFTANLESDYISNLIYRGDFELAIEKIKVKINKSPYENDYSKYSHYLVLGNRTELLRKNTTGRLDTIEDLETFNPFFELINSGEYKDAWEWLKKQEDSDLKILYTILMLEDPRLVYFDIEEYWLENNLDENSFEGYTRKQSKKVEDIYIKKFLEKLFWYLRYVDGQVINGYPDGTFKPNISFEF